MTQQTTSLKVPTVHLNGTSADALKQEIYDAVRAVHDAKNALAKMTVHGRDYYVQADPDACIKARAQQVARIERLNEVEGELAEMYKGICEQEVN
jgi:deoxycytidylate deaminase